MKLEPIDPQEFTDYVAYSEKKRTRWERFLDKIKPRSAAMRTTVLVVFVVLFSLFMSLWFFWRTLYLPEIQQHARYLAVELEILNNPDLRIFHNEAEVDVDAWLKNRVGIEYVTDPREFPNVREKVIAEFFTQQIEKKLATAEDCQPFLKQPTITWIHIQGQPTSTTLLDSTSRARSEWPA